MRKISECSNFTEDEDDERSGNFGGFTSTVCVNFSEDDLRLATIPGQVFNSYQFKGRRQSRKKRKSVLKKTL